MWSGRTFRDQLIGSKLAIFKWLYLLNAAWRQGCLKKNLVCKICLDNKSFRPEDCEGLRNRWNQWFCKRSFIVFCFSALIWRNFGRKKLGGKILNLPHCALLPTYFRVFVIVWKLNFVYRVIIPILVKTIFWWLILKTSGAFCSKFNYISFK